MAACAVRRVALMIASLKPGGGERVVVHLTEALRELDVHADVICLQREGELGSELREKGVGLHVLNSTSGWDFRAAGRLRRLLKELKPDLINIHDRSSLPYLVAANAFRRCPIVYTAHGLLFNADREPRLRYRLAVRAVASAVAVSPEVAARHTEVLGFRGPWRVIPNGVPEPSPPSDARRSLRAQLGIDPGTFVFLAMGNVREEKGFEDLLTAANRLASRAGGRRFVCLVAGRMPETPYVQGIRKQHARLGLVETVKFLGYRSDGDALRSAADAFVLSSRSEGLPMVVLEAMMSELPVVATRVGGVPEVLSDGAGLTVDPASPDQLAGAMARMMDQPDLPSELARKARRRAVQQFSASAMARRYLDAYTETLERSGKRGGRR